MTTTVTRRKVIGIDMPYPTKCPGCGLEPPKGRTHCSQDCQKRAAELRRKARQIPCENCGSSFLPHFANAKYCSDACYKATQQAKREARQATRQKPCQQCGQTFLPSTTSQKFCSTPCFQAYRKAQQQAKADRVTELITFLQSQHTFSYNIVTGTPCVDDDALVDAVESQIQVECASQGFSGRALITDILMTECHKQPFHPIKDYFEGLVWDNSAQMERLCRYIQDSTGLFDKVFRRWMNQAIRKVYDGEQNEMVVLVGAQGIGKSLFVEWLCPPALQEYYAECGQINPHDKDHKIMATRNFFGEVGELGATTKKADVRALKDHITKKAFTLRRPYGKREEKIPVLMSYIGTENEDGTGFLRDLTGNRRYLPLDIIAIDFHYTQLDVDMLWAEAFHAYQQGTRYTLTPDEKLLMQGIVRDHSQASVEYEYLVGHFDITGNDDDWLYAKQILDHMERLGYNERQGAATYRIAQELQALGVTRERSRQGTKYRGLKILPVESPHEGEQPPYEGEQPPFPDYP